MEASKNIINELQNETEKIGSNVGNTGKQVGNKFMNFLKSNNLLEKNKLNILYIIIASVFLIFTAYIVYNRILKPRLSPSYVSNNELTNSNNTQDTDKDNVILKLYWANWCNHSQQVMEKDTGNWAIFLKEFNNKIINGKKINMIDVDCSDDSNVNDEELVNIEGYPTIKLVTNGTEIIYNNDISNSNKEVTEQLKEFINNNI